MKRQLLALFVIALVAEISASWWTWVRAPTDSLRAWYKGSFITYELERLVPWLVIFIVLSGTLFFIEFEATRKTFDGRGYYKLNLIESPPRD